MSEQREALAEALWRQFGYPSDREWEELLNEDRDDWRADAQTLLTSETLARLLADAEQRGADRVAAAVEAVAARHEHGALRWADPLPVPEWIAEVRAALTTGAAARVRAEEGDRE